MFHLNLIVASRAEGVLVNGVFLFYFVFWLPLMQRHSFLWFVPEGTGRHNIKMFVLRCHAAFTKPLIG